jgi:hypothetical protein
MNVNHSFKSYQRVIDECDATKNIRLEPVAERANAIRPYGILVEIKALLVIKFLENNDVIYNP